MNYLPQILFSLGAIGFINSLIVSLYFLISKSYNKQSNRLFGLFLFVLSFRVLKSIFYAFSTADSIWYINTGPSFFFLIGPLLFSYLISVSKPKSFWAKNWKYHIVFWCLLVIALMIFVPFKENVQLNKEIILPIINVQLLIYIILSGLMVLYPKKNLIQYKWFITFISVNLIIWASFALIDFDYFISGSIIFSVFFYTLFLFFLFNKKIMDKIFIKNKIKKTVSQSIEFNKIRKQLDGLMQTEKLYTNTSLKIVDVAEKLELSVHELSKLLNDNLGRSFNDFINEHRIEEAKHLIVTENKFTIEAIGQKSGFNSKSAFYKAFKNHTGTTPAKYKASL
ncbi:helix-turn-helix domain-containing protein [Aquimarina algicola]|uniref:AraC family transcriptional regulator n=1 Tax=Aquimarina algicola TaxID=2589995 RepID=A0A504JJX9_9FLAO|nr:helix-turn-helix domain-containing protein [Aquimarina algicola]TPN86840.1 AraC family transcriptional regulator [Aquimarina algicola]